MQIVSYSNSPKTDRIRHVSESVADDVAGDDVADLSKGDDHVVDARDERHAAALTYAFAGRRPATPATPARTPPTEQQAEGEHDQYVVHDADERQPRLHVALIPVQRDRQRQLRNGSASTSAGDFFRAALCNNK